MAKTSRSASRESPDQNYISVWQWLFIQFLMILPLINLVVVLVLAFVGSNRTRKNFFRAFIIWVVMIFVLHFFLFVLLVSPDIFKWFKELWKVVIDLVTIK